MLAVTEKTRKKDFYCGPLVRTIGRRTNLFSAQKGKETSPGSGRMKIAQRLIAGIRTPHQAQVRETDD